jgi:protein-S-isoprenylcysteine O-methyltransferase Ste14
MKIVLDELIFRSLLLAILVAFAVIWFRAFILSGITRDAFYTTTEGFTSGALVRFLLTTSIVSMGIYVIHPEWMRWSGLPLPSWLRLIGLPLGLWANTLLFWSLRSLGRNFFATLIIKKNHILVTDGPYRWIRHPMYATFVLFWIAFFLLSANWFIGLTGIMAYALIIVIRVPKEERMMIDGFDEEYVEYMKRTGRFLPRIRGTRHC